MRSRTFLAAAALLASTPALPQGLANPLQPEAEVLAEGKRLYNSTGCIACHGNNARGAVGPDLTDDEWLRQPTDEMIFNTIRNGRSGTVMSGFGSDLTEKQIWTIITWLRDENRKRK